MDTVRRDEGGKERILVGELIYFAVSLSLRTTKDIEKKPVRQENARGVRPFLRISFASVRSLRQTNCLSEHAEIASTCHVSLP